MRTVDLMVGDWVLIHEPECKGHRIEYISEMDEEWEHQVPRFQTQNQ